MALDQASIGVDGKQGVEPGHVRRRLEHPAVTGVAVLQVLQEAPVRLV
jgi:hypothetical protein